MPMVTGAAGRQTTLALGAGSGLARRPAGRRARQSRAAHRASRRQAGHWRQLSKGESERKRSRARCPKISRPSSDCARTNKWPGRPAAGSLVPRGASERAHREKRRRRSPAPDDGTLREREREREFEWSILAVRQASSERQTPGGVYGPVRSTNTLPRAASWTPARLVGWGPLRCRYSPRFRSTQNLFRPLQAATGIGLLARAR